MRDLIRNRASLSMMTAVDTESRLPELEALLKMKSTRGRMAADYVRQITEIPDVYRFQNYLSLPNVQDLGTSEHAAVIDLLTLFSQGSYGDYQRNLANIPPLSEKQIFGLRCLTLASLAKESRHQKIPFMRIQDALGFADTWQVFDFLIEALNYNYVKGKMDEPAGCLIVEDFITRDVVAATEGKDIRAKLELFMAACENTQEKMKEESARIDEQKRQAEIQKRELVAKVENLRGQITDDVQMSGFEGPVRQKVEFSGKLFKTRPKSSSKSGGQTKMGRP